MGLHRRKVTLPMGAASFINGRGGEDLRRLRSDLKGILLLNVKDLRALIIGTKKDSIQILASAIEDAVVTFLSKGDEFDLPHFSLLCFCSQPQISTVHLARVDKSTAASLRLFIDSLDPEFECQFYTCAGFGAPDSDVAASLASSSLSETRFEAFGSFNPSHYRKDLIDGLISATNTMAAQLANCSILVNIQMGKTLFFDHAPGSLDRPTGGSISALRQHYFSGLCGLATRQNVQMLVDSLRSSSYELSRVKYEVDVHAIDLEEETKYHVRVYPDPVEVERVFAKNPDFLIPLETPKDLAPFVPKPIKFILKERKRGYVTFVGQNKAVDLKLSMRSLLPTGEPYTPHELPFWIEEAMENSKAGFLTFRQESTCKAWMVEYKKCFVFTSKDMQVSITAVANGKFPFHTKHYWEVIVENMELRRVCKGGGEVMRNSDGTTFVKLVDDLVVEANRLALLMGNLPI